MQNNGKVWWNNRSTENILIPVSATLYENLYLLLYKSVPSLEFIGSSSLHTWNWNVHISFLDPLLPKSKSDIQKSIDINICGFKYVFVYIYEYINT